MGTHDCLDHERAHSEEAVADEYVLAVSVPSNQGVRTRSRRCLVTAQTQLQTATAQRRGGTGRTVAHEQHEHGARDPVLRECAPERGGLLPGHGGEHQLAEDRAHGARDIWPSGVERAQARGRTCSPLRAMRGETRRGRTVARTVLTRWPGRCAARRGRFWRTAAREGRWAYSGRGC